MLEHRGRFLHCTGPIKEALHMFTSLTDEERKELSDKVREANKRSETGRGGQ